LQKHTESDRVAGLSYAPYRVPNLQFDQQSSTIRITTHVYPVLALYNLGIVPRGWQMIGVTRGHSLPALMLADSGPAVHRADIPPTQLSHYSKASTGARATSCDKVSRTSVDRYWRVL